MKHQLPFLFLLFTFLGTSPIIQGQNIKLELNPDLKNQMNITESPEGTYDIQTLGVDPWIVSRPVSQTYDPDQVYVISFDYIAPEGLDNLHIFYGASLDPANRRKDFGSLLPSSKYTSFKAFMKYEVDNWNAFYDRFRFDFGKSAGQQITIKDLQVRAAMPGEVVPLNLDLARRNQMSIAENPEDMYNISTLGGDPFIYSEEVTQVYDPQKTFVLAFDYTSSTGLDDLQIFYGKPTSPARRVLLGSVPASNTKKNITAIMAVSAPVWDSFYKEFRFDFGRFAGQDIQVSNIVLREPTNAEKKLLVLEETVNIELDVAHTSGDMVATEIEPGSYVLNTSGNDPWILSKPIEVFYDVDSTYIISFEYKTETAYNRIEVFYGPPINETHRLATGELPASTEWTTFSTNPRIQVDNFQDSEWTNFRFDFGKAENEEKTISIRNIKIRKPTPEELEAEQNSDKFMSRAINQKLLTYLNTTFPDSVSNVKITKDSVLIQGMIENVSEDLYLAEIEPHEYGFDQTEFNFVVPLNFEGNKFSVELPRYLAKDDHDYDRLYSRWAVVEKSGENIYALTSSAQWAGDISAIAENNLEEDKAGSIKGLDGLTPSTLSNFQDLKDLGIKSMKINLLLNRVFNLNPTGLTHEFNGKTYNISPGFVENLDALIKKTTKAGIKNAFVLLIPYTKNKELARIFNHPDAYLGQYSMANVATAEGVEYYTAMIDFLAKRYSRPDQKYGRLDQWIIHNEVDAHDNWTHAGHKPVELYTEIYDRSMRMVHYTIRKHNPTAKVFASFTKHWSSAGGSLNFKPKDILETLVKLTQKEGDYEWNIAWHSYPDNLFDPTVWNDPPAKAQFNYNTPQITPKNLEMIDAYVRQKEVLYNGKKVRTVLLSENGFSSNGAKNANANQTTQAAALAYFWKKTNNRLPSIENIQLHRWVDHPNEAGLLFGLWTVLEGTTDGFNEKKEAWYVWEAAGTSRENEVFDPYKAVIGIESWSEIQKDVPTEVTPFTVEMKIDGCNANLDKLLVSFNGELKIPQEDGSLIFYNVASNVPQPYKVKKGNKILASDTLQINEDLEISIELKSIEDINAKGVSPSEIEITWASQLTGISGFVVEVKEEGDTFTKLDSVGKNEFSYVHEGVTSGKRYTYRVAALYDDDNNSLSCYSEEVDILAPFITVLYQDGDGNNLENNTIKPFLQLKNESNVELNLGKLKLRYWFTAENFAALDLKIDYARLGEENITGEFFALQEARNGANYYLELSFAQDLSIDSLANSGDIKARIVKSDWTDFDEVNDYSYSYSNNYIDNVNITAYWDGELIWGIEPKLSDEQKPDLMVLHKNEDNTTNNLLKPGINLVNNGNVSVPLKSVSLRYWFTPESNSPINFVIDYSKMNEAYILGNFFKSSRSYMGATDYIEISFKDNAGELYAFSETGQIKTRIQKQDWSSFNETDDFSYQLRSNSYQPNIKITAYINGVLVWGEEPSVLTTSGSTKKQSNSSLLTVYPNPTIKSTNLKWNTRILQAGNFRLIDYNGNSYKVNMKKEKLNELTIQLPYVMQGVYILKGNINGKEITHRLLIGE